MPPLLKLTSLVESARVGADSLRSNPLRTVLATTGVIIGVAALVVSLPLLLLFRSGKARGLGPGAGH